MGKKGKCRGKVVNRHRKINIKSVPLFQCLRGIFLLVQLVAGPEKCNFPCPSTNGPLIGGETSSQWGDFVGPDKISSAQLPILP